MKLKKVLFLTGAIVIGAILLVVVTAMLVYPPSMSIVLWFGRNRMRLIGKSSPSILPAGTERLKQIDLKENLAHDDD